MKRISLFILSVLIGSTCFAHPFEQELSSRLDSVCNAIQLGEPTFDLEKLTNDIINRYTEFSDEYTYFENIISVTYYNAGYYIFEVCILV